MTKEKTAMYVRMALLPGYGFRISEDSYLQTNGKQYRIIGSDSIPLGEDYIVLDDSGRKDFVRAMLLKISQLNKYPVTIQIKTTN